MGLAPSSALVYHGSGQRFSALDLALVIGIHVAGVAALLSLEVVPVPAPLATLMVRILPPAPPPAPDVKPARPQPVAAKVAPRPRPEPVPAPPPIAAETPAPSAPALVPSAPAPPAAPAVVTPAPAVSEPRFDAAYLDNPAPGYPSISRRLGEEGKVVLRVFVDAAGRAGEVEVKTGSGFSRLDQAAVDAVRRWKFVPPRRGSDAVEAWVLVPIVFNLRGVT